MKTFDVLVIGGGITGLTAARETARYGCATALIEAQPMFGGQIANVDHVDGYPGQEAASGMMLGMDCVEECRALGVEIITGEADGLTGEDGVHRVSASGAAYRAKVVVIASGARLKQLGVPGESAFVGRGVSQCASCDGPLFRDEDVAVIGGGDAAAQEALVLTDICRKVTLVCRSGVRAKRRYAEPLADRANVTILEGTVVDEILGTDGVEQIRLRKIADGSVSDLPCRGVFPFIGTNPNTGFLSASIRCVDGYVVTDSELKASVPGVFAAGAVRHGYGGQLADAVDEAAAAAKAAAAVFPGTSSSHERSV